MSAPMTRTEAKASPELREKPEWRKSSAGSHKPKAPQKN